MSLSTYKSDLARRNGEKKYAKTQRDKAMEYVLEEWQKNDGSYTKASFSTYMVGRVLKIFSFEITARQMERVWLKGR